MLLLLAAVCPSRLFPVKVVPRHGANQQTVSEQRCSVFSLSRCVFVSKRTRGAPVFSPPALPSSSESRPLLYIHSCSHSSSVNPATFPAQVSREQTAIKSIEAATYQLRCRARPRGCSSSADPAGPPGSPLPVKIQSVTGSR